MPDKGQEFAAKSVDEAIAEGLQQLGLHQDQVDVEIISRGSRGIFGLGSEPARVRLTPKAKPERPTAAAKPLVPSSPVVATPTPPSAPEATVTKVEPATPQSAAPVPKEPVSRRDDDYEDDDEFGPDGETGPSVAVSDEELAGMAASMLEEMISLMGFSAHVVAAWKDTDDHNDRHLLLNIEGDDLGALIGRRGETLASIQYLVRLMVNQRIRSWKNIIVDVEQYKERRVTQLTQLALRMADQVTESGRAVSLEPMPASERRIVHLALRDHPSVYTQSSGEGERRKVHIVARD